MTTLEIRHMKLADLTPAEYNPRVDLKPGDPEYDALVLSLETDGVVVPIIWNETTGRIVGGHQRYNALAAMGVEETDVSVVHLDETKEKQANIALNRIEGEFDDELLHNLFKELEVDEIYSTGFSEEELRCLYPEGLDAEAEDAYPEEQEGDGQEDEAPEPEETETEFTVFLSFPAKEKAEAWLKSEGIEGEFSAGRNLIIHMEGQAYGN